MTFYLDVFEMDFLILAEVDDGAKKVEETFVALEGLKYINECSGLELFMVFGGYLHADLEVLSDVVLQHGLEAFQGVLNREGAKVVYQPLKERRGNIIIHKCLS